MQWSRNYSPSITLATPGTHRQVTHPWPAMPAYLGWRDILRLFLIQDQNRGPLLRRKRRRKYGRKLRLASRIMLGAKVMDHFLVLFQTRSLRVPLIRSFLWASRDRSPKPSPADWIPDRWGKLGKIVEDPVARPTKKTKRGVPAPLHEGLQKEKFTFEVTNCEEIPQLTLHVEKGRIKISRDKPMTVMTVPGVGAPVRVKNKAVFEGKSWLYNGPLLRSCFWWG